MGYTTKFTGAVKLGRKLTLAEAKELLEVDSDKTGIDAYFQWVPADTLEHIVWDGEETGDVGTIIVLDNEVSAQPASRPAAKSMRPLTLDILGRMALDQATA